MLIIIKQTATASSSPSTLVRSAITVSPLSYRGKAKKESCVGSLRSPSLSLSLLSDRAAAAAAARLWPIVCCVWIPSLSLSPGFLAGGKIRKERKKREREPGEGWAGGGERLYATTTEARQERKKERHTLGTKCRPFFSLSLSHFSSCQLLTQTHSLFDLLENQILDSQKVNLSFLPLIITTLIIVSVSQIHDNSHLTRLYINIFTILNSIN